jgi:ABC-type sugar transport system permease subunit
VTIVILIQTIFLLGIFAEIRVTTGGGPGYASTNIAFLVFRTGILSNGHRRRFGRWRGRRHHRQHRRHSS